MRKFNALVGVGLKTAFAYKFDFFISLFTGPLTLLIFYFLWKTIYEYSGQYVIQGYTFSAMVTYYAINAVIALLTWNKAEKMVEGDIIYGDMTSWLVTPISYFKRLYFFTLGISIFSVFTEAVVILAISFIFFSIEVAKPLDIAMFLVSVALSSLIYFLLSYLIGLSSFWLGRIDGLSRAKKPIIMFLGGGIIPLAFFPTSMQGVFDLLPFKYVRAVPISIYLGQPVTESLWLIACQLIWVIILSLTATIVWDKAFKKFAGAGV